MQSWTWASPGWSIYGYGIARMDTKISELTIGGLLKLILMCYGIYIGLAILFAVIGLHVFLKAVSGLGIFSLFFGGR